MKDLLPMSKGEFEIGSSTVKDFFYWINERTSIWKKRFIENQEKPWSDDPIFQQYKFTNAYRQLDRGTIALTRMIKPYVEELRARYNQNYGDTPPPKHIENNEDQWDTQAERETDLEKLIIWNIMWYRYFNLDIHAEKFGWCDSYTKLHDYITDLEVSGDRIFTSAHMTTGCPGEEKSISYLRACKEAWDDAHVVITSCLEVGTLYSAFETLKQFYMVGPFISYEIVCDLRFTPLLENAPDILTWANVGPGAKRGLMRLGMEPTVESMIKLWDLATKIQVPFDNDAEMLSTDHRWVPWPFELREIEHSLCEFDKYIRAKSGQGRPRCKYKGI